MTKHWTSIIRASIGVLLCIVLLGAAEQQAHLYVVNALSQDLSIIDTSDSAVSSIPLGARGYRIAFSPGHNFAYITTTQMASAGTPGAAAQQKAPSTSGLLEVDLAKRQVVREIPLSISPLANVHVSSDGKKAYVVTAAEAGQRNAARGQVLFVDLTTGTITRHVNIGLNPLDSVMTPDGTRLFIADWGSRSVSVVDLAAERLEDTIPLGMNQARVLAMAPKGDRVFIGFERSLLAPPALSTPNEYNSNAGFANNATQSAQFTLRPDPSLLWAMDVKSGEITRLAIPELRRVVTLAVAPDGKTLYLYGIVTTRISLNMPPPIVNTPNSNMAAQQAGIVYDQQVDTQNVRQQADTTVQQGLPHAQNQPQYLPQQSVPFAQNVETYDLMTIDLTTRQVTHHFGSFGPCYSLEVDPDGKRIYLIGTPGDPVQEAAVREKMGQRIARLNTGHPTNSKDGRTIGKGDPPNTNTYPQPENDTVSGGLPAVNDMIDDLRQLRKTVTVVDAVNGQKLKTLTIGSLPQGSALVR